MKGVTGQRSGDHLAIGRNLIPFRKIDEKEDNSQQNATYYERAASRRRSGKRMKEEMKQKRAKKRSEDREMITEGQAAKRKTEKGNIRRQLHL